MKTSSSHSSLPKTRPSILGCSIAHRLPRRWRAACLGAAVGLGFALAAQPVQAATAIFNFAASDWGFTPSEDNTLFPAQAGESPWTHTAGVWRVDGADDVSRALTTSTLSLAGGQVTVSFVHTRNFEQNADGGTLQMSLDGGATFPEITNFTSNGYDGTLITEFNPLQGLQAFWEDPAGGAVGPLTSVADLGTLAAGTLQLRFNAGWDDSNLRTAPAWSISSLTVTGLTPLAAEFWKGTVSGSWFDSNWASDQAGTLTPMLPDTITDVTFSATGATNQVTTLDANFTIHSLTVNDTTPVSIASGTGGTFTLTIAGNAGTGITVNTGANLTISSPVTFGGASDTIAVNGTGLAVISGSLTSPNGLIKTGTGSLTLLAANNITGTTQVSDGHLILNGPTNAVITNALIVGDSAGATSSAVLQLGAAEQIADTAAVTVNIDGLLALSNFNETIGSLTLKEGNVDVGTATLTLGSTLNMTGGAVSGSAGGLLKLGGDVTATNGGIPALITTNLDLNGTRTFTVTNNGIPLGMIISGVISDGTFIKAGAGTLQLAGTAANTYTGGTFINSGILTLNGSAANGTIPGDLTVGDGIGNLVSAWADFSKSDQISDTAAVTVNSDGLFNMHTFSETIGSLTMVDGIVQTGTLTLNNAAALNMTGGQIGMSGTLVLKGDVTATSDAAGNAATIFSTVDLAGGLRTFTVNAGPGPIDLNISGVIQNGGLQKSGTGIMQLSGANTYTGGTNIVDGRLITQGTSALGVGGVNLLGGVLQATGTLNMASLAWYGGKVGLAPAAGDVINPGAFVNAGGGGTYEIDTLGLQQATYTITTFGAQAGFTLANFSAVAKDPNVTINAQFILNANSVQLTILGETIVGPIIQNSAPVNTPTFADFIITGPVTTGGGTDNTVHSITFAPGGSLSISNTLYVTGGPVTLPDGSTITLGGNLSTSQLNLLPGSQLNGNGNVFGNIVNGGTVSPGHSPGRIHATGNYTQTATGILRIDMGGRDLSQHDVLTAGGTAQLDGTLQLVQLNNFKLKRNKPVTFLTAAGGVSGRFSMVQSDFPRDTILEPTVIYRSDSVALEAVQGSFESFAQNAGLSVNQRSVARALDSAAHDPRANSVFEYLDYRKLNKLPKDFDKIAPEELTSVFTIGVSLATVQSQNIQRRTDDIRSGTSGFNAANLALNGNGPSYSGGFSGVAGPSGHDGKESKATKEVQAVTPAENRWGVFLSGTGEWVSVGNTDNARGYDLESGGFTLGLDYKVTPNFALGLMAGYTGTTADLTDRGRVWVNGGKVGLYATFFQNEQVTAPSSGMSKDAKEVQAPASYNVAKGFYADLAVNGGYNSYGFRRSALQGDARGDTDGGELNALAGIGYDFRMGGLTFGPTATFNYTYIGTNDFTERGSLVPLNVHGGKGESLRSAFGLKASYDWKVGGILIKPEIRAAWQHEYGDTAYALDSNFANGSGDAFTVEGPQLGRDSVLLGAGFAIMLSERASTYLYYDGELGRKNYQSTNVTGGFRYAF